MAKKLWTTQRKFAGNFFPFLTEVPFAVYGVMIARQSQNWFAIEALASFFGSVVAAYFGINFFGLFRNRNMRSELAKRFSRGNADDLGWFVGIATPGYMNLWDPHEDVGFLKLSSAVISFQGETKKLEFPRASVRRVSTKKNPHSYLGLGGWIVVDGILENKPIRLLVEPRVKDTLIGNKRFAKKVAEEIRSWAFKK